MKESHGCGALPQKLEGLSDLIDFGDSFRRVMKQGISNALADCPKCHFHMLQRLHFAIKQHGNDGKIYVNMLASGMRESPQGLSRTLRMLENEGLILRETDRNDRRKTFVSLTEKGEQSRRECEAAVGRYLQRAVESYGIDNLRSLLAEARRLEAAMSAESEQSERARQAEAPPPKSKR